MPLERTSKHHFSTNSTNSSSIGTTRLFRYALLCAILLWNVRLWQGHGRWIRQQQQQQHQQQQGQLSKADHYYSDFVVKNNDMKHVFGACLMFKDDLSLLPEWIAYHYTTLPLRYLVIGTDVGNQQDPRRHLELWRQTTRLQYKVLAIQDLPNYSAAYLHNHPNTTNTATAKSGNMIQQQQQNARDAHHALVNRQRIFIQACTRQLKQQWRVHWTAFVDTDEYITFANTAKNNQPDGKDNNGNNNNNKTMTVAAALATWQKVENWTTPACYTMPRLRYGNLENVTCANNSNQNKPHYSHNGISLKDSSWLANLTTLRFFQHASFDDFAANKFGKALVNLSAIPNNIVPWNIHRPYKDYCVRPVIVGDKASRHPLRVNHYTGTLARFLGRGANDARRTAAIYQQLTSRYTTSSRHQTDDDDARNNDLCDNAYMQGWVSRFLQAVKSQHTAQHLLQGETAI